MRLEVLVSGQDTCTKQLLLQNLHKVQQILGLTTTDVVNSVWWDGQAVFARQHLLLESFYY